MTELPIQTLLLEAIEVLDRLGIEFMIMGGFAVRSWGVPRPTYDADLAIAAQGDALAGVLSELRAAGFEVPREHEAEFLDRIGDMEKVKVTRFADGSVWDVDLFLAKGSFFESAMARRRTRTLDGRDVYVMAPEDVILLKLVAYRRKDQVDVEEIVKIQTDLDLSHLRSWANRLGVADRLDEFLGGDA